MQIEYELDRDCLPKKIHIIPSKHEDIEMLHNISSRLIIENPSLALSALRSKVYSTNILTRNMKKFSP